MTVTTRKGTLLTVWGGYALCPSCHSKLLRLLPTTQAGDLVLYCKRCRREVIVTIQQ